MTSERWLTTACIVPCLVAFLCGGALLQAVKIVRQPDYAAIVADPSLELQDSAFRLRGQICDVLIDGDSTAAVGVDPRVISDRTGLTACNIATSRPIVDDLGTLPLDTFLQNNSRPKLLVLQYGAEDFYRSSRPWLHVGPYAPLSMVVRNLPRQQALRIMLQHPAETIQFTYIVLRQRVLAQTAQGALAQSTYRHALLHAVESHGQLDLSLPSETACRDQQTPLNGPLDRERIRGLRARYEQLGMLVLIRAAPVPSCDPMLTQYKRDLAPYVDGNVEPLPVSLFASGDRHTTSAGSLIATLGLVRLIDAHQSMLVASTRLRSEPPPPETGDSRAVAFSGQFPPTTMR